MCRDWLEGMPSQFRTFLLAFIYFAECLVDIPDQGFHLSGQDGFGALVVDINIELSNENGIVVATAEGH